MSEYITGRWSGTMTDAQGFQAQATLELRVEKEGIRGDVQFQPILEHPEEPQKGTIIGIAEGDQIELKAELDSQLGKTEISFKGEVWPQKTAHAMSTIYGTYRVSGRRTDILSVGTAIFWLYKDQN